jgi:tetratricopeptide (TPR) repeat protein
VRCTKQGAFWWPMLLLVMLYDLRTAAASSARDSPAPPAAALYDKGASAYDAGRYEEALSALAEADALSPNDVTLELALKAALRTSQAVQAMELSERATGRGERILAVAAEVRSKFERRVGTLRVLCAECEPRLEGLLLVPGASRLVEVGEHELSISSSVGARRYRIRIGPAQHLDFRPRGLGVDPQGDSKAGVKHGTGLSPAWMWLAAGVSTALSVATVASALDTRARYASFQRTPDAAHASAGTSSQSRTNWLLGSTLVSAGVTVTLGVFVVEWDASKPSRSQLVGQRWP